MDKCNGQMVFIVLYVDLVSPLDITVNSFMSLHFLLINMRTKELTLTCKTGRFYNTS